MKRQAEEKRLTVFTGDNPEVQQQLVYENIMKDTMKSSSSTLLLPSVPVTHEKHESADEILSKLSVASLSGVDSVNVVSFIQNIQEETGKALCLAKHYRDVAETVKKRQLQEKEKVNDEVEVVRKFWRNNIKEGSTRAGKMVQMALTKH